MKSYKIEHHKAAWLSIKRRVDDIRHSNVVYPSLYGDRKQFTGHLSYTLFTGSHSLSQNFWRYHALLGKDTISTSWRVHIMFNDNFSKLVTMLTLSLLVC